MFTRCFGGGKKDRLSELPQDILEYIILLLQTTSLKSIACFAMTSKVCLGACRSCPYLSFLHCPNNFVSLDMKKTDFVKRVDQSLLRMISMDLYINCFNLLINFESFHILSRWMDMVFALNVRVINLEFVSNFCIVLPVSLFSGVSFLQELRIEGCQLELCYNTIQDLDFVWLSSLKRFTLKSCKTTSAVVEAVLQGCPLLEHLELTQIYFLKSLAFPRLLNLKTLDFSSDLMGKIDVEAPSLTEFSCSTTIMPQFNVLCWFRLRKLSLSCSHGMSEVHLRHILSQLTNLESISIGYCKELENLVIINSSILYIQVINCGISGVIQINCPKLRTFTWRAQEVPRIIQQYTYSSDWKLDLHLEYCYLDEKNLLVELRRLISDTKIRVSCLHIEAYDLLIQFNMREKKMWKDQVVVHPAKLKYLKIDICTIHNSPNEMLNYLLWIFHPQFIVLKMENYKSKLSSIKNKMKKTRAIFECGCCKGRIFQNCWHHSLSFVKFFWSKVDDEHFGIDSFPMNWEITSQSQSIAFLSVCYKLTWQ